MSLFLSTARTDMLPIRGMMESTLDPRMAAVSDGLIAAAFLLMLIMEWAVGLPAAYATDGETPWK